MANPPSKDEILIKTQKGQFKIWQNGQLIDFADWEKSFDQNQADQKTNKIIDTGLEEPVLGPLKPAVYQPRVSQSPVQKKYGIFKIVNKVNDVLGLNYDDNNKNKLKNIIYTYCRHTRGLLDCLEILQKPSVANGLDLSEEVAEKVMSVVKTIMEKIEAEGGLIVDEARLLPQAPVMEKPKMPEIVPEIKKHEPIVEKKPVQPVEKPKIIIEPPKPIPAEKPIITSPVFIRPRLLPKDDSFKVQRPQRDTVKLVNEVKKKYLVLGPVEELATMKLVDFRRLAEDTNSQVNIILTKINSLAEESYTKKSLGINAWRQSEPHRMYLALGEESFRQNLPIEQLIKNKQTKGEATLSLTEFEAISDLSRHLRF
jgi:hypothetical protein